MHGFHPSTGGVGVLTQTDHGISKLESSLVYTVKSCLPVSKPKIRLEKPKHRVRGGPSALWNIYGLSLCIYTGVISLLGKG